MKVCRNKNIMEMNTLEVLRWGDNLIYPVKGIQCEDSGKLFKDDFAKEFNLCKDIYSHNGIQNNKNLHGDCMRKSSLLK